MEEQSYPKHAKYVPLFHYTLIPIALFTLIGAVVNLVRAIGHGNGRLSAALLVTLSYAALSGALYGRVFALKAQDRLIRAEENMRHYLLTGKPLDSRLTVAQIIGLRFACDAEFPALAQRAAAETLTRDAIKKSIKTWKADNDRL